MRSAAVIDTRAGVCMRVLGREDVQLGMDFRTMRLVGTALGARPQPAR
jgi:hypothetical protein